MRYIERSSRRASPAAKSADLERRVDWLEKHRLVGDPAGWPMYHECLHPQHLTSGDDAMSPAVEYEPAGGFTSTIDLTYYRGFYAGSSADGDYLIFILRLGPQGSFWNIQPIVADSGSGKLRFEWAQHQWGEDVPDGEDDGGGLDFALGSIGAENALASELDFGAGTFDWHHAGAYEWNIGNTGRKIVSDAGTLSQMRIIGAPGDVLSADGAATLGRGYFSKDMNGGPGIWYLKMTAVTHPVKVSSVLVARQTAFDYSAI